MLGKTLWSNDIDLSGKHHTPACMGGVGCVTPSAAVSPRAAMITALIASIQLASGLNGIRWWDMRTEPPPNDRDGLSSRSRKASETRAVYK